MCIRDRPSTARNSQHATAPSSPAMLYWSGPTIRGWSGTTSLQASRCKMALSKASMGVCAMSCSTRHCSPRSIRPDHSWPIGGKTTTPHGHTPHWDGKHRPNTQPPYTRAGLWNCATQIAQEQRSKPKPSKGTKQKPETKSGLDKTWGQCQ